MRKFRGSLDFLAANEVDPRPSKRGRAYVPPGSSSGVTVDVGVDLAHIDQSLFKDNYQGVLSGKEMDHCLRCKGIYGQNAKALLRSDSVLRGIHIPYEHSLKVFPIVASKYWEGAINRWPALLRPDVLPSVHTAIIDVVYNRGVMNRHLSVFDVPIMIGDWKKLSDILKKMQQRHSVAHVAWRRRAAGKMIEEEITAMKKEEYSPFSVEGLRKMKTMIQRELENSDTKDQFTVLDLRQY